VTKVLCVQMEVILSIQAYDIPVRQ
jgi:hypothetical protein